MKIKVLLILVVVISVVSCNFPKDPNSTFQKIKKKGLLIGVVNNPPYRIVKDSSFTGKEVGILKEFCNSEDLSYRFITASETDLVKNLKNFKIDIVIGGFEKNSVWKKDVGMTKPYDKVHVLLIPKGENRFLYQLEKYLTTSK